MRGILKKTKVKQKQIKELNDQLQKIQSVDLAGINIYQMHFQLEILKSENIRF
jgi:hypothetical protein